MCRPNLCSVNNCFSECLNFELFKPLERPDITYLKFSLAFPAKVRLALPTVCLCKCITIGTREAGRVYLLWAWSKDSSEACAPNCLCTVRRDFYGLMTAYLAMAIAEFTHVAVGVLNLSTARCFAIEALHCRKYPTWKLPRQIHSTPLKDLFEPSGSSRILMTCSCYYYKALNSLPIFSINSASIFPPFIKVSFPAGKQRSAFALFRLPTLELL